MSKKSMIAVCLCGLAWAGTAQAGFLGNSFDLQLLQTLLNGDIKSTTLPLTVPNTPGATGTVNINGIDITIGDTTVDLTGPAYLPSDLTSVDKTASLIAGATGTGNGTVTTPGPNNILISGLSGQGIRTSVDVSFVPEPGAFDLMALGLTILGMTIYQRKRASAKAACGEFSVIRG